MTDCEIFKEINDMKTYGIFKKLVILSLILVTASICQGQFFKTGGYQGGEYGSGGDETMTVSIVLDVKVLLEGPYNGTDMNVTLNTGGYLPLDQPYDSDPLALWYYTGTEGVAAIPNADVVDWILIELRDAPDANSATGATMIAQKALFLLKDGTVSAVDGISNPELSVEVTDNLFIVIWHRNHLGVLSANPMIQAGNVYSYDFTTGVGQAYGGVNGHKDIGGGIFGMAGGDGLPDGQVNNGDKLDVWAVQAGSGGYLAGDFNLDVQVNNGDKNDIWRLNGGMGSQVLGDTATEGRKCMVPN